jgi:hypothetical protein
MLHLSADDLADLYAVHAVHEFPFLVPGRPERYEEMLCEAEMSRRQKALRAGRKIPAASSKLRSKNNNMHQFVRATSVRQ